MTIKPYIKDLSRTDQIIYYAFVTCLLVTYQPIKSISYVSYIFFLIPIIFFDTSYKLISLSKSLIIFLSALILFFFYNNFIYESRNDFLQISYWISFIYWGHIWTIIVLKKSCLGSAKVQYHLIRFIVILLGIQTIIGLLQFWSTWHLESYSWVSFQGGIGDFVSGTMRRPFFKTSTENLFYTLNCFTLIIYYLIYSINMYKTINKKWLLIFAITSTMLAGVIHLILMLVFSIILTVLFFIIYYKKVNRTIQYALLLLIPSCFGFYWYYADYLLGHIIRLFASRTAKLVVTEDIITKLPQENSWFRYVGAGPGQLVSKVNWLRSGYSPYTGSFESTSLLPQHYNELSIKYLYNNISHLGIYEGSSFHNPFYSLLSIYSEFGIIGISIFYLSIWVIMRKVIIKMNKFKHQNQSLIWGIGCLIFLFLFQLLPFISTYIELSQGIFIPMLITGICYYNIGNPDMLTKKSIHNLP